ncbi:hypothetical protein C8R45DRAFT_1143056 [Mycena sanguinolenta]|nr:hypothetical protein C8R45DRAFT_1143056 [Mycena sanguinolenta]
MFSARFIALILVSAAAAVHGTPKVTAKANSTAAGEFLAYGCYDDLYNNCVGVPFKPDECVHLPDGLVNAVSSFAVPDGFYCTIYDGNEPCVDNDWDYWTIAHAPGLPRMWMQNFNDAADYFKCSRLCK